MKIIHCADIHLDAGARLDGVKTLKRKDEVLETFLEMIARAESVGAAAVLIAGDLFDKDTAVRASTVSRVLSAIGRAEGARFFYLRGNHDKADVFDGCSLPDNLHIFESEFETAELPGGVTVSGMSGDCKYVPKLPEDKINIVMAHGEGFSPAMLDRRNISYLALGHYHTYSEFTVGAVRACYCGCIEGRGFDECGAKGYVLLDTAGGGLRTEFIPASRRVYKEIRVDVSALSGYGEIDAALQRALEGEERNIVKLILEGNVSEDCPVDLDAAKAKLSKVYAGKIVNEMKVRIDPAAYAGDVSLKGFFVKEALASGLPEDIRNEVIVTGLRAIRGER